MKYRKTTYWSFKGKIDLIELSDFTYGEWIIYENKEPRYHINISNVREVSNTMIKSILESGKSIEYIISAINKKENRKLSLRKRPLISTKGTSELIELNLTSLPKQLLKNIT